MTTHPAITPSAPWAADTSSTQARIHPETGVQTPQVEVFVAGRRLIVGKGIDISFRRTSYGRLSASLELEEAEVQNLDVLTDPQTEAEWLDDLSREENRRRERRAYQEATDGR